MKMKLILPFALLFLVIGCSRNTPPPQSKSLPPTSRSMTVSEWDKVKISSSGEILVNNKQMGLTEFATECQRLKQTGGAAVVYTGEGEHVLSPAQAEAVQKLTDAGVPMKLAMKESDLN